MEGCIAPSEVPGVFSNESSVFGKIAEDLIYMDFYAKHAYSPSEVYVDNNNEINYLYFLKRHNPAINLTAFAATLRIPPKIGMVRPDILIHSFAEKVFYEIKPNSADGRLDGITKVGTLSATYIHFNLPYKPGLSYRPGHIIVASVSGQLTVKLKAELMGPGLIVYKLCLDSDAVIDLVILAAILRYVIKKMNEQARGRSFRPIDLQPAFAREGELSALALTLGLVMATGAAVVGWKFFWKAAAKRFAARGATAALLAAADGPLPVGDLMAAGMALWTVIDIIRFSNELWAEAARLANQEA